MSSFKKKNKNHAEKQERMSCALGKKQAMETACEND